MNSLGQIIHIKIYEIEKLPKNGVEDISFMKFWKDNSKCQNEGVFKLEIIILHKNNCGRNIITFH